MEVIFIGYGVLTNMIIGYPAVHSPLSREPDSGRHTRPQPRHGLRYQ